MAPADEGLLKTIETTEDWLTICGEAANKDLLFIVEVYAAWCGPSIAALSTYRKIKEQNEQKKFKLCKVCADLETPDDYLEKYKINARPTYLLFKDGDQVATVAGVSMPMLEK
jgi:thioredoxin 1